MYYRLDINEFFKDDYEALNNASGIGGMGFITSKQSIHLYNDIGLDKKTNIEYLGIGDHYELTTNVLKDIYGTPYDSHLYELISIKYWNSVYFKVIAMYFPKTITKEEYRFLCDLEDYYKYIFEQYRITVGAYEFGNNVIEYGPDEETKSDLGPILKYAEKRLDNNLVRTKEEKMLYY